MNTIWQVPRNTRPNPLRSRLRSIVLLVVGGLGVTGTTALTTLGSQVPGFGVTSKIFIGLGTLLLNTVVFSAMFRIATAQQLDLRRQILPGAAASAVVWQGLQYVGAAYVKHAVRGASEVNGVFALLLGLIAWIYLGALVVVAAAEYNAVRSRRLYPRALLTPFTDDVDLTNADERSYRGQAEAQRAKGFQEITVRFDPPE